MQLANSLYADSTTIRITVNIFRPILLISLLSYWLLIPNLTTAQTNTDDAETQTNPTPLCRSLQRFAPQRPTFPDQKKLDLGTIQLFADEAEIYETEKLSTFSGNVLMRRGEQALRSSLLKYDKPKDELFINEAFTLWDRDYIVQGSALEMSAEHQGEMHNTTYWLLAPRGRIQRGHGTADTFTQTGEKTVQLRDFTYTTCDPDKPFWHLKARKAWLDQEEGEGQARGVTVRLGKVPVFYTPYLSFPLDDRRKTGFLAPTFGSSDEIGVEVRLPYYINLAPNYDLTLTPRAMSRRGLMLESEFRYLTEPSQGVIEAAFLHYDNANDKQRGSVSFRQKGMWMENLYSDIDINYVSDNQYFEELGNELGVASTIHLDRRLDLYYFGYGWNLLTRLQTYQTLLDDPNAHPYQRLPQIQFRTQIPEQNLRLHFELESEFVHFDRDTEIKGIVGNRLDLKANLSLPWRTSGIFVVPQFTYRHTRYDLSNADAPLDNAQPQRNLYTLSLDSGVFLERSTSLLGTKLLHTLEPHAYYRYTPYRDQAHLPIFDTGVYDLSYELLFHDTRYSGPDRVEDANQLSLGATTRLIDRKNGLERLRFSVGQILYFDDREVTLSSVPNDSEISKEDTSNLIVELGTQINQHWRASATTHWNPHSGDTEYTVLRTRYQQENERIVNLSYRFREERLEQTDLSFYMPLNKRWRLIGRWNYSMKQRTNLEAFAGVEYESCCWAIRLVGRQYLNNENGDHLNGFFVQFELKGLGGLGRRTETFLAERILGYDPRF